eukprot:scaffold243557_cov31-Tisochrysis_lutea.AAC.1
MEVWASCGCARAGAMWRVEAEKRRRGWGCGGGMEGSAGMTTNETRRNTRGTDARGSFRARAPRNKRHRSGKNGTGDGRESTREL